MAECHYCSGDPEVYDCLHHIGVEAIQAVSAAPNDPVVQYLGHRFMGCDALLRWLHDNGWTITPPEKTRLEAYLELVERERHNRPSEVLLADEIYRLRAKLAERC